MKFPRVIATVGAVALAVAASVTQSNAQAALPGGTQAQTVTAPVDTADSKELTVAGCLMRHRDVPIPTAAIALNSAVKHDGFLLVDAMTVPHHRGTNGMQAKVAPTAAAHDHTAAEPAPVVDPPPNVADSQMFKVEGLSDAELEPFAGTRVTLMGALIVVDTTARRPVAIGGDAHDAAGFQATMIHPASTPCRQ